MSMTAHAAPLEPLMTEREVADFLRVDRSTLCRWRLTGTSPLKHVMVSPTTPRYRRDDVEAFAGGKRR